MFYFSNNFLEENFNYKIEELDYSVNEIEYFVLKKKFENKNKLKKNGFISLKEALEEQKRDPDKVI